MLEPYANLKKKNCQDQQKNGKGQMKIGKNNKNKIELVVNDFGHGVDLTDNDNGKNKIDQCADNNADFFHKLKPALDFGHYFCLPSSSS